MNIFYLDNNPQKCAEYHCDKHVVKMILETAQLLSTAIVETQPELISLYNEGKIYKPTHKNHPSAVWCRKNKENFKWLWNLWYHLLNEYAYRYWKRHKSSFIILNSAAYVDIFPDWEFTQPTQAMPDEYKDDCSIKAYQHYYDIDKQRMHSWKRRPTPYFITKK